MGLGVLLAVAIRALFASFGLDLSGTAFMFAPGTVLAAYAMGIVVTLVAAYLPARRSARIAPVAAMRDDIAMPEWSMRRRFVVGMLSAWPRRRLMVVGLTLDVPKKGYWVGGGIFAALLGVAVASPVIASRSCCSRPQATAPCSAASGGWRDRTRCATPGVRRRPPRR